MTALERIDCLRERYFSTYYEYVNLERLVGSNNPMTQAKLAELEHLLSELNGSAVFIDLETMLEEVSSEQTDATARRPADQAPS